MTRFLSSVETVAAADPMPDMPGSPLDGKVCRHPLVIVRTAGRTTGLMAARCEKTVVATARYYG
jgi:hypothetical protein